MTAKPVADAPLTEPLKTAETEARTLRARRDELQANLTNLRGQRDELRQAPKVDATSRELKAIEKTIGDVETLVDQADHRLAVLDRGEGA